MEQKHLNSYPAKFKLVFIFLALLGVTIVFLSTSRYGAGLSPDSIGYIGSARNIIVGAGVTSYNGSPLIVQPPLFPTLLAIAGGIFKTDPLTLANTVNAIIFGAIVYFGGLLFFKYLPSYPIFAFIGLLAIVTSPPLFKVSVMAWSEPLFILFVILSLLFANSYLEKNDVISLILLSLSVSFSTLTRYIGVVLILWGVFVIIVLRRDRLKNKIAHLSLFTFISVLPIGIWLIRNYAISSTFLGTRTSSVFTLSQNLMFVFNDLISWYIPNIVADHRPTLLLLGVTIGFLAGNNPKKILRGIYSSRHQIGSIVLFILFYTVFLVASSTTTSYDRIGDRLLSPIYVPLTLFFFIIAKTFAESYGEHLFAKIVYPILITCTILWLLMYPLRNTLINAVNLAATGQGYSHKDWAESETILYLLQHQELESKCTFYTNGPDVAYALAHITSQRSPARRQGGTNSSQPNIKPSEIGSSWPEESNACLIWFDRIGRSYLFTVDELQDIIDIDTIANLSDGAIYSISRK